MAAGRNRTRLFVELDCIGTQDHRFLAKLLFMPPVGNAGDHLDFDISFQLDD